ncbi:MAG: SanA/YdcF family protein [Spirochaetota bacterium]
MQPYRFIPFLLIHGIAGALVLLVVANTAVTSGNQDMLYRSIRDVPPNRVGLLLGTTQYAIGGGPNPFFWNRIDAAVALYRGGRIDVILASGDNERRSYNEPIQMQRALMDAGVPEHAIVLDFAGFRTLDSIARASEVFGQRRFTIISQELHLHRALYIARHYAVDAIAYAAEDVSGGSGFRVRLREILARVLAVFDLHVLRTEPRYLGDPVRIP